MGAYVKLSEKLRGGDGNQVFFECPGCEVPHGINVGDGPGPRWTWNADVEKPTFTPSILVNFTWGHERVPHVCHSFITDGRIQFLGDCTHALAGQTVDIPDWDTA